MPGVFSVETSLMGSKYLKATFLAICFMASAMIVFAEPETILRIGIETGAQSISLTLPAGGDQLDEKSRRIKSFRAGETFSWSVQSESSVTALKARHRSRRKVQTVVLAGRRMRFTSRRGPILINGRPYRGYIDVSFTRTGAQVINCVGIEDYVRGVVGSEVGSLSPGETLKAQAVIARTYAIANRGKHGKAGFDLCNREHCQVYGGVKAERSSVDTAVNATRGIIMISDGVPISTMYHATCGGMTSDNEKVYGGTPTKYLRRVRCDYCKSGTKYRWNQRIEIARLRSALASEGLGFNRLYGVETVSPAPLDRVDQVRLKTDRGELRVKGTTFRRLFNLPSTTFAIPDTSLPVQRQKPSLRIASTPATGHTSPPQVSTGLFAGGRLTGPSQLIVQTAAGVRRTRRPASGWVVAGGRKPPLATPVQRSLSLNGGTSELNGITIFGRGYGHQVGLCQAGAVELGRRRWSYRQILALYYSHVALRQLRYDGVLRRK